jgi:hypothetical protein
MSLLPILALLQVLYHCYLATSLHLTLHQLVGPISYISCDSWLLQAALRTSYKLM